MNVLDCNRLIKYMYEKIGLVEEQINIGEAVKRIDQEATQWKAINREAFWENFTQEPCRISPLVLTTLDKFEEERIEPGVAVELGCGNSMAAIELLKRGWKVIAVDISQVSLDKLKSLADASQVDVGNLTLVCQDMETYKFPKNVLLILANNSFPYCNPHKIIIVWNQIYDSLEVGGRIVGNFFPPPSNSNVEDFLRMLGTWFTDKESVNALLNSKYVTEVCQYNKFWFEPDPRCIEFIGHKVRNKTE